MILNSRYYLHHKPFGEMFFNLFLKKGKIIVELISKFEYKIQASHMKGKKQGDLLEPLYKVELFFLKKIVKKKNERKKQSKRKERKRIYGLSIQALFYTVHHFYFYMKNLIDILKDF